tara:strand:- start:421 stop:525 length:105 start_codon:yes stop_codon:yes gene_type:complete
MNKILINTRTNEAEVVITLSIIVLNLSLVRQQTM